MTLDTVYYVILVDENYFKLAANATDAGNGTNVVLSDGGYQTNIATKSSTVYGFRDIDDASFNNRTINIPLGDVLNISLDTAGSGNMYLCYDTDDYDANKYVVNGWNGVGSLLDQSDYNTTPPTGTGSDTGTIVWNTNGYRQSFTNPADAELFSPSGRDVGAGRKYIY